MEDHAERNSSKDSSKPGEGEEVPIKIVKATTIEPKEYTKITLTIPKNLLDKIDEACKLYDLSRSKFIQDACLEHLENLTGTDKLHSILRSYHGMRSLQIDEKWMGVRDGLGKIMVNALIYRLSRDLKAPGLEKNAIYLTPENLEIIQKELEKEKTLTRKNKWIEFSEKTGLDPENLPKDKIIKISFE